MARLKETNPEMSPHIDHTINKVGLRLPSPSPSHSPAQSARSVSSRSSSIRSLASARSKQSISSARSDVDSLKMKQGILSSHFSNSSTPPSNSRIRLWRRAPIATGFSHIGTVQCFQALLEELNQIARFGVRVTLILNIIFVIKTISFIIHSCSVNAFHYSLSTLKFKA